MLNARAFVYPSLYEGFGIPLLEAFAVGTPVAASRIPVFEEIYGFSEAMFDPRRPDEVAGILRRVCADEGLRQRMILHGQRRLAEFDWGRIAEQTLRVYGRVAGGHAV